MNTRTTGLLVAFALALIIIGVVLFVYIRHASAPVAQPVAPIVAAEEQIQAIAADGALQTGSAARIQGTAKDDPERRVYDFTAERIDPKPNGVYEIESPAGWIYLKDNRAVHVRAERGQVVAPAPAGSEMAGQPAIPSDPEEGNLAGDVVIRLFEGVGPDDQIDPETTTPAGTFRTDVLRFNAVTGELSTPQDVEIRVETPDFTYRGTWLRGQYDQVRERFFVRVERRHQLEYVQKEEAQDQAEATPSSQAQGADGTGQTTPAQAASEPAGSDSPKKEDLYHCVLVGDLMLQQVGQGRWLKADRLELWARLLDGQLPDGAIAPLAFGEERTEPDAAEVSEVDSQSPGAAAGQAEPAERTVIPLSDTPPDQPNVITLTWSGPLMLSPLDETPAELEEDHAALRFSGLNGNRVLLTDDGDGSVSCALLHYGATTRRAMLANTAQVKDGTTMGQVVAESVEYGTLRGPVIRADLTTGLASVDGGGAMIAVAEPEIAGRGTGGRRIDWSKRADFRFRTAAGRVIGSLQEALLSGEVVATDGRGKLEGDSVRALFVQGEADAEGKRPDLLQRLIADGEVLADGGADERGREIGSIAATHLDVEFETAEQAVGLTGGEPTPRVIEAWGTETQRVITKRAGERLESGRLLANTRRDEAGNVVVTRVSASEGVVVSRDDGIQATAARMEADGLTETADFFENVVLSRTAGAEESAVVRGEQVRVGGEERVINVFGSGDFSFASASDDGEPGALKVTWTNEMRFNDAAGQIDCVGDVVAINEVGELATDVLRSHRVVIDLEPVDSAEGGPSTRDGALAIEERRVREIRAIGESTEVAGGEMAVAELRRYVADEAHEGGRRLERFARLKGDRIIASEVEGTLLVPGPGDAALYDARAVAAAKSEGTDLLPAGGGGQLRGATLFRWDGALTGNRAEGTLVMKRAVEMVHKPLDPEQPEILMVCEDLLTRMEEPGDAPASAAEENRLSQIEAEGAVYVRADTPGTTQRKELIADRLFYDAATGKVLAWAREGNQVKLFDVMRGAPVMARELEWDLVRDAIRVKEMSGSAVR